MAAATNHRFRIQLPKGWSDVTVHLFHGPDIGGMNHDLTLSIEDPAGTGNLEQYADLRVQNTIQSIPECELVKQETVEFANGTTARDVYLREVGANGRTVFHRMVFMIIDSKGYTFRCRFTKHTLKTIGVEVQGIIDSLITDV